MPYSNDTVLSNEEIRHYAPSAFALAPYSEQSAKYKFIPTSVVIDGMRNNGFLPVKAVQSKTRVPGKADFTKHMIRFRAAGSSALAVGDTVSEVVLINSHDGTSAYDLSLGLFRKVCGNGLMVDAGNIETIHIRHMGNILEEVITGTQSLLGRAPMIGETVNSWRRLNLSGSEQKLLAESAASLRFEENTAVNVDRLLASRRWEDNGQDLWSTFNRIQENVIKGGIRMQNVDTGRRNRSREVKGIDQNVRLNRALWHLAERMAELKTAV